MNLEVSASRGRGAGASRCSLRTSDRARPGAQWRRGGVEPSVIALEGFHERLGDAVGLRAAHGREARHEADGVSEGDRLVGREAAAVVGQPLHRAAGPRARKRRSTASSMRSRTAIPPMPRGLAVQARTSRSWVSIANATRTAFAVPARISNTSAAQRGFEAGVATSPSWGRWRPHPVWRASSSPVRFNTR